MWCTQHLARTLLEIGTSPHTTLHRMDGWMYAWQLSLQMSDKRKTFREWQCCGTKCLGDGRYKRRMERAFRIDRHCNCTWNMISDHNELKLESNGLLQQKTPVLSLLSGKNRKPRLKFAHTFQYLDTNIVDKHCLVQWVFNSCKSLIVRSDFDADNIKPWIHSVLP